MRCRLDRRRKCNADTGVCLSRLSFMTEARRCPRKLYLRQAVPVTTGGVKWVSFLGCSAAPKTGTARRIGSRTQRANLVLRCRWRAPALNSTASAIKAKRKTRSNGQRAMTNREKVEGAPAEEAELIVSSSDVQLRDYLHRGEGALALDAGPRPELAGTSAALANARATGAAPYWLSGKSRIADRAIRAAPAVGCRHSHAASRRSAREIGQHSARPVNLFR
jgi:hypothetical protein